MFSASKIISKHEKYLYIDRTVIEQYVKRLFPISDGVTGCGLYLALSFLLEKMTIERECDVVLAIRAVKRSRPDFVKSLVISSEIIPRIFRKKDNAKLAIA